MSDDMSIQGQVIKIKKNDGITQALKALVDKLQEEHPNSVMSSDGKITAKEWNATMDKLVEINEKRQKEGKGSIFTGGTDKTKAGWHTSFIVKPDQEIEFTADEMKDLYEAMGISFKTQASEDDAGDKPADKAGDKPADKAGDNPADSTRTPQSPADTTGMPPKPVDKQGDKPADQQPPADSTRTQQPPVDSTGTPLKPADQENPAAPDGTAISNGPAEKPKADDTKALTWAERRAARKAKRLENVKAKDADFIKRANSLNRFVPQNVEARDAHKQAAALLDEMAAMKEKPEVMSGHGDGYDRSRVVLKDGRRIDLYNYEDGKTLVAVSYDTTPDQKEDGQKYDGAEALYIFKPDGSILMNVSNDHSTGEYDITNIEIAKGHHDKFKQIMSDKLNNIFGEDVMGDKSQKPAEKPAEKPAAAETNPETPKTSEKAAKPKEAKPGRKALKQDPEELKRKAIRQDEISIGIHHKRRPVNRVFEESAHLIAEIANMDEKPEVKQGRKEEEKYSWAYVKLSDGKCVQAQKYDDGRVIVLVSTDTTPNDAEMIYEFDKDNKRLGVAVDYDKEKQGYEYTNDSKAISYLKPNMMKLFGKIFGEDFLK